MNTFTLTPLQRSCPRTHSPAASVAESAKFNPRPLAVVISTAGGGALSPPPRATTTMPSSPSRTLAAAGCPGRPPMGGAIAASTPSSGCLHRRSGTSGSSAGIFPAITARGDCRKRIRCPRCRPRLLWPRASPPRGVPSCSSDPRRSSRPAPRHGSTTRRVPSPPSSVSTAALGGVAAMTIAAPLLPPHEIRIPVVGGGGEAQASRKRNVRGGKCFHQRRGGKFIARGCNAGWGRKNRNSLSVAVVQRHDVRDAIALGAVQPDGRLVADAHMQSDKPAPWHS